MTATERPPLGKLKPGQKVMVRRSAIDMRNRPAEDRYVPAQVVKVGRVWVTLSRSDLVLSQLGHQEWRMRMDTQAEASQFSGNNASFLTMEQYAWEEARHWGRGVLTEHGIQLATGSRWHGREAELAELILAHEATP